MTSITGNPRRNNLWANIDWITVAIYTSLVLIGWINIYSSVYNAEHSSIFDFSQRYGKQLVWIVAAFAIAFVILLIDSNFYMSFAYFTYTVVIFLLVLVLLVGTEINGSKSWFSIGSLGIQPSEFSKLAVSLALARYMSRFEFKLQSISSYFVIATIILMPVLLIILQKDTGSALVYVAFVIVLFREGLSGVVLFFCSLIVLLFVCSLVMSDLVLNIALFAITIIILFILTPKKKYNGHVILIFITSFALAFLADLVIKPDLPYINVFMAGSMLGGVVSIIYFID